MAADKHTTISAALATPYTECKFRYTVPIPANTSDQDYRWFLSLHVVASQRVMTSQTAQTSQRSQRNEQGTQKQPVKQRPHRTIYLPDDLDDEFESVIDRLQYETKSEEGVKLAKNRHTYPLIVYLGLERASDMTPDEVLTTLTETDILDTPEP